jgi:NADPH:quinone reductase-like Zn-dependent oxidoreductase
MRNVVIFGTGHGSAALTASPGFDTVEVDAVRVRCGVVETPSPGFDPTSAAHARSVLVNVKAFSCNYRDRAFFYTMQAVAGARFIAVGSEFAGEVAAVGSAVTALRPGDRVMSNQAYTGHTRDADGVMEGVVTNHASKEFQIVHENKLTRIPAAMSDDVAAGFGLNAQTAYSMIRRLEVAPGAKILVTAATSNTSLAVISALGRLPVRVHASTTSPQFTDRIRALGVEDVVALERAPARDRDGLRAHADRLGGFDAVVDPFFDLHLESVVEVLRPCGKYITCGLAGQTPNAAKAAGAANGHQLEKVLVAAIGKNLTLFGNCLGVRADLERALSDYAAGSASVVVDSAFAGSDQVRPFLDRTFNDRRRFGKVVYRYDA